MTVRRESSMPFDLSRVQSFWSESGFLGSSPLMNLSMADLALAAATSSPVTVRALRAVKKLRSAMTPVGSSAY